MTRIAAFALGVAVAIGSAPSAFAADAPVAPPGNVAAAAPDKDPVICKKESTTGSRLGSKKVCKTKSQWADDGEQTKSTMRTINIKGASGPGVPGG